MNRVGQFRSTRKEQNEEVAALSKNGRVTPYLNSGVNPVSWNRHNTHWTGHPSRLEREWGKRFGDDAYAFEELVSERAEV